MEGLVDKSRKEAGTDTKEKGELVLLIDILSLRVFSVFYLFFSKVTSWSTAFCLVPL